MTSRRVSKPPIAGEPIMTAIVTTAPQHNTYNYETLVHRMDCPYLVKNGLYWEGIS